MERGACGPRGPSIYSNMYNESLEPLLLLKKSVSCTGYHILRPTLNAINKKVTCLDTIDRAFNVRELGPAFQGSPTAANSYAQAPWEYTRGSWA